ncbi:MAG: VacB/RNase II family 3'-5' exoribonuclease [Phycisphaeraceae bacterium]|nr:VacB/RNase II family 3'-5' exoribonuclease [Phycisphaeraceae bacterium]
MDRFSKRILDQLTLGGLSPRKMRDLATALQVPTEQHGQFEQSVRQLAERGQIMLSGQDTIAVPPPGPEMTGTFRLNPRKFGFLTPDTPTAHGDLFVPEGMTGGALTGDRVRAKVIHQPGRAAAARSPYIGQIIEILQRADRRYVGNLEQRKGQWVVMVDGKFFPDPVVIRDPHAKNAKAGDKVVVELIDYPEEDKLAEGVITEVLGVGGEPDVETAGVIRAYGLSEEFPAKVMQEAREASRLIDSHAAPSDRLDLTSTFILTIDPPDAKDFDDAISIRRLDENQRPMRGDDPEGQEIEGGGYELGVHIADVAHFVRPGSAMDKEAFTRGNSAYLPRKVIPMLPEVLSNGVCSLQEGVIRYCISCFIRYDDRGRVIARRFARTAIKSAKRLTYLEAQALIEGDIREATKHAKTEPRYPSPLIPALRMMDELARKIRQRRLEAGMIVLGLPEVELVFDESGRVIDAAPEDTSFTHTLIEMFMVEANEALAELFEGLDVPLVRRIHPDPPSDHMGELRQFARVAGFNIPLKPTRQELQHLLDAVRGKPSQQAVHLAVLQTLARAEYSPLLIGHFALASEHYAHFTSPIRRYPDLIAHRQVAAYCELFPEHRQKWLPGGEKTKQLARKLRDDPRCPELEVLVEAGRHCSATERNADAAEKDLRSYLVLELLLSHLGDDFDGTVTGVTGGGVFVQIDKYLVDGYIRLDDLARSYGGQRWALNRKTGALVATGSGKTISIGDRFVVRVARVLPQQRQLDLAIVQPISAHPGGSGAAGVAEKPKKAKPTKRRQPQGARTAHAKTAKIKQQKSGKKPRRR